METDYKSYGNSHKQREEAAAAKAEKAYTTPRVTRKKASVTSTLKKTVADIGKKAIFDMIIPGIKTLALDALQGAFDHVRYGRSMGPRTGFNGTTGSPYTPHWGGATNYTAYSAMSANQAWSARSSAVVDPIMFRNRVDAERVLERMDITLRNHGKVTVGNFYEFTGTKANYTDHYYGWTSLVNVKITAVGNGQYMIEFPALTQL